MVSEVRTPDPDEGDSLKDFINVTPLAGSVPVLVGDDLTDEHAIVATEELGHRSRPSAAGYWLASVATVRAWLTVATTGWTE